MKAIVFFVLAIESEALRFEASSYLKTRTNLSTSKTSCGDFDTPQRQCWNLNTSQGSYIHGPDALGCVSLEQSFELSQYACLSLCNLLPADGYANLGCCYFGPGGQCYTCVADAIASTGSTDDTYRATLCSAGLESTGDPHTSNIKGESFDIRREGSVLLLRHADESEKLAVTGVVEHLGPSACSHLFFTKITVRGTWLNGKSITVTKTSKGSTDFVLQVDRSEKQLPPMSMNEVDKDHMLLEENNGESTFTVTVSVSKHTPIDVRKRAFKIKVEGMTLQVETRLGYGFLDFYAYGLGKYAQSIGGIIGNDDHSEWALAPEECRNAQAFDHADGPFSSIATASP